MSAESHSVKTRPNTFPPLRVGTQKHLGTVVHGPSRLFRLVFLRDPVRFSVWLFTEWAVCGLVEEGEEGSVRSKPSDPLFNRAWIGNEVENDLR